MNLGKCHGSGKEIARASLEIGLFERPAIWISKYGRTFVSLTTLETGNLCTDDFVFKTDLTCARCHWRTRRYLGAPGVKKRNLFCECVRKQSI